MRGLVTLILTSLLINQSVLAATEDGRQLYPKQPKIPLPNERLGPDPHAWEKPKARHPVDPAQKMEAVRESKGEERARRKGWEKEPKPYHPNPGND